jgi:AGCS family alanine or glycine:cation symporter
MDSLLTGVGIALAGGQSAVAVVKEVNDAINGFIWGPIMCAVFLLIGIFLSIRTGMFQVSKIKLWWSATIAAVFKDKSVRSTSEKKAISQFQALSTALAATIGTGNIVGVATAIASGGPGAVFWMWISAFFGMMTKFSEIALSMKYRYKNEKGEWMGGPMVFLEKGLHQKWLAVLFAVFATLASFGIGCANQANSVASALNSTFGFNMIAAGIVLAVISALVILGGIKRIARVTEFLVPFMAIVYIVGGLVIILINVVHLPAAFGAIFSNAFSFRSVGGGLMGYVIAQAMRFGIARGIFSNEAGLGSSSMAHSATDTKAPIKQAMWGCFEVFADTIVVCSITALAILTSGVYKTTDLSGAALTIAAFDSGFGSLGGAFVSLAIVLFAYSTIIGWSFYGTRTCEYLFGVKSTIVYKIIFLIVIILGCTVELNLLWNISDTLNGLMAIPNLIGLIALSGTVAKMTKDYISRKAAGKLAD